MLIKTTIITCFLGSTLFLINSCSDDSSGETKKAEASETAQVLEGTYVRVADNNKGGDVSSNFTLIDSIIFHKEECEFQFAGNMRKAKYKVARNRVTIEAGGELGNMSMEMVNDKLFEGEGWIHGTFHMTGNRQGDLVASTDQNESSEVTENDNSIGEEQQSNNQTQTNSSSSGQNTVSTTTNNSSGSSTGKNVTTGTSSASSSKNGPVMIKEPKFETMTNKITRDETITLLLSVDTKGNVLYASVVKSKTTSKDEDLIKEVRTIVQRDTKFNSVYGYDTRKIEQSFEFKAN